MITPRKVVLATGNPGKLRELQRLLGDDYELIPQTDLDVRSVEETGQTFRDNAILKARHAAAATGLPAIADDSGLEVDALNGAPGVRSARFAGPGADDQANNKLLLERLANVLPPERNARFRCVIAYVASADDAAPLIAEGVWEGQIATEPSGANGFGYDPLFIDPETGGTSAALPAAEKNRRSHRGKAVRKLCALLDGRSGDRDPD